MILQRQTFLWFLQAELLLSTAESPNDSCGWTEVLRPSQTTNHHLALSGTVFSRNISSNWLNLPPHPPRLLLASDQSLSLKWKHTPWPLSLSVPMPDLLSSPPNGRPGVTSFLSLLFCHLIPLKGRFSLERLCKLGSASASPSRFLSVTETRWKSEVLLWPGVFRASLFDTDVSCPLMCFHSFSSFKWDWFLQGLSTYGPGQAIWTQVGMCVCVNVWSSFSVVCNVVGEDTCNKFDSLLNVLLKS